MGNSTLDLGSKALLRAHPLVIADVGATGGPEIHWKPIVSFCRFHTFDPDPRAELWSQETVNHPVGLWSSACQKTLHLMQYPPSSSLFPMNLERLEDFQNRDFHHCVGKEELSVETLDHCLGREPIDFLKIDAEGSELAILQGGTKALRSCLGLQVEAAFFETRKGAPFFSDLDPVIRSHGFDLFCLKREHWLRKKSLQNSTTSAQLIWANAVYLLPKKSFLERLSQTSDPDLLLTKFFTLITSFHLYDYALELLDEATQASEKRRTELRSSLPTSSPWELLTMLGSCLIAGLRAFTASKRKKRHRVRCLKRKLRQLANSCLYYGRNDYALYDD